VNATKIIALIITLLVVSTAGICAFFYYQGYAELEAPIAHTMSAKIINIPEGSTTEATIAKLVSLGIIKHTWPLKLYVKCMHQGSLIKAGDYSFPSPVSPLMVLQQLESGGQALAKLTIVEGWTRWDVADAMAGIKSLKLKNADQALALMNDTTLIADLDKTASNLEGYLFPDTYFVQSNTTAKSLIQSAVDHFHEVWIGKLAQTALQKQVSVHDAVTIASIVETEAKLTNERPLVASVIYNRLKKNMPLSVDSTIVYASKLAGKWKNDGKVYMSDVNRKSPYNTRIYPGLPPGPVSCPGLPSMQAAVTPADTTYIYYVRNPARNDGAHNFYSDATGFEKGVEALRQWEKQRDAAATKKAKSH